MRRRQHRKLLLATSPGSQPTTCVIAQITYFRASMNTEQARTFPIQGWNISFLVRISFHVCFCVLLSRFVTFWAIVLKINFDLSLLNSKAVNVVFITVLLCLQVEDRWYICSTSSDCLLVVLSYFFDNNNNIWVLLQELSFNAEYCSKTSVSLPNFTSWFQFKFHVLIHDFSISSRCCFMT